MGCHKGAGIVVDIDDDEQGGKDASQNCPVCLQIIGPKQDDEEKEVQENELVGDEISDGGGTEQDIGGQRSIQNG